MIFIGYFAFALALGFLLGASNTPVIGAFIAALAGLAGALAGSPLFVEKDKGPKALGRFAGIALIVFSGALIAGELIGESYRTGRFSRASTNVPWRGKAQPEGTFEALDWIAVQEMLLSMGYSREVVEQVYKIRIKEVSRIKLQNKGKDSVTDYAIPLYDEDKPFNAALKASGKPAPSRGPASE